MDEYEGYNNSESEFEEDNDFDPSGKSKDLEDEEHMVLNPTSVRERIDVCYIKFDAFLFTKLILFYSFSKL